MMKHERHDIESPSLHRLIHSVLNTSEKRLISVVTASQEQKHLNDKRKLYNALYITRARILKLLMITRWISSNSNILTSINTSVRLEYKFFLNDTYKIIKNYMDKTPLIRINIMKTNHSIETNEQEITKDERENSFVNFALRQSIFYNKRFRHQRRVLKMRDRIFINGYPLYLLTLKISKSGFYKLKEALLLCPRSIKLNRSILKKSINFISSIDPKDPQSLDRIDRYIIFMSSLSQYIGVLKEFQKVISTFNCELRKAEKGVDIVFSEAFRPYNVFNIEMTPDGIIYRSTTPLFHPPINDSGIFIDERFDKSNGYSCENETRFKSILKKFFFYGEINTENILTRSRDSVYFTKIINTWEMLKSALMKIRLGHSNALLRCSKPLITEAYIEIAFVHIFSIRLKFDSLTGEPIWIREKGDYASNESLKMDLQTISESFTSIFFNLTWIKCMRTMFGNHWRSLKYDIIPDLYHYQLKINETDYSLVHLNGFDRAYLSLINSREETFQTAKTMTTNLLKPKEFKKISDILRAHKILAILLELQDLLKRKNYTVSRTINTLYITLYPFYPIKFKIRESGYWILKFYKVVYPHEPPELITVIGLKPILRFCQYIVNIIDTISFYSGLMNIKGFSEFNNVICSDLVNNYEQTFFIASQRVCFLRIFNFETLSLDLKLYRASYIVPYLKSNIFHYPIDPFANRSTINAIFNFPSFLSTSLHHTIVIYNTFYWDKNWTLIKNLDCTSYALVYDKKMTCQVNKNERNSFIFIIPKNGISSCLLLPLSRIAIIDAKKPCFAMSQIIINDFPTFKNLVDIYQSFFYCLQKIGIDKYRFEDNRILGTGVKFYQIMAIVDKTGMILSSPAFPPLRFITEAFHSLTDLNIKYHALFAKNLIVPILFVIDDFILPFLGIIKAILSPTRIRTMNFKQIIKKTYINLNDDMLKFYIIENNKEIILDFNNPKNHTVDIYIDDQMFTMHADNVMKIFSNISDKESIHGSIRSNLNML